MTVITNGHLTVATVALSAWVRSVTLEEESEEVDASCWGDTQRVYETGMSGASMGVEFKQDYATSGPYQTIAGLYQTQAAFILRPFAAAVSTSNPEWTGNVLVSKITHMNGDLGTLATMSANWRAFDIATAYA